MHGKHVSLSWVPETFHARFPASPLVSSAFGRKSVPAAREKKTSVTQGNVSLNYPPFVNGPALFFSTELVHVFSHNIFF